MFFRKSTTFQTEWWSIEIPQGWTAVQHPECATFQADPPVGALQISGVRKLEGTVSNEELEGLPPESTLQGTKKEPVQYGPFDGFRVRFVKGKASWEMWWLRHRNLILYVTYNVDCSRRAKEIETVEKTLYSLRPLLK